MAEGVHAAAGDGVGGHEPLGVVLGGRNAMAFTLADAGAERWGFPFPCSHHCSVGSYNDIRHRSQKHRSLKGSKDNAEMECGCKYCFTWNYGSSTLQAEKWMSYRAGRLPSCARTFSHILWCSQKQQDLKMRKPVADAVLVGCMVTATGAESATYMEPRGVP
ncbi:unnamed protein product [Urochloa humidicola]